MFIRSLCLLRLCYQHGDFRWHERGDGNPPSKCFYEEKLLIVPLVESQQTEACLQGGALR